MTKHKTKRPYNRRKPVIPPVPDIVSPVEPDPNQDRKTWKPGVEIEGRYLDESGVSIYKNPTYRK